MRTQRVYGEPVEIHLHADGSMSGRAGFAGEDRDYGRWWLDGDRYVRQWQRWSYAETASYAIVLDGDTDQVLPRVRVHRGHARRSSRGDALAQRRPRSVWLHRLTLNWHYATPPRLA